MLQHKDNPVDWYPWGKEAFEAAQQADKPVFLSIGYSTCHWCHVMAHESFEDTDVAELLKDFVCIKVDREERPDIDSVYMNVCQALTGSGGWPLTVLMTPEQKPFFAGTYFPKTAKHGQLGLTELLKQAKRLWDSDREKLINAGNQIADLFSNDAKTEYIDPDKTLLDRAYELFGRSFDSDYGGFGSAPKFPAPHNLLFLLRYYVCERKPFALKMVEKTLECMAKGGIFDHIGGGFSRYSTDEKWLIPHFEKMLYDNALLIAAYIEAYLVTKKDCYAHTARRTADYILRELTDKNGGFYCGQDADTDGEEGKYYAFTPSEIKSVLGTAEGDEFCRKYGIYENGSFGGKSIPNRIGQDFADEQIDFVRLEKLYEYRKQRSTLRKDDKILLSWNAWAIIALAEAGFVLNEERYSTAAAVAQRFIEENMRDEHNRLLHSFRDGEAAHAGLLDDYAVYALSLLELYRTAFDAEYLKMAILRAEQMTELFEDNADGGYFINAHDSEKLIARPKELYDGAIPSGNSVAAVVLGRIASLTGETLWHERSDRLLRYISAQTRDYPAGYAFSMLAISNAINPHRELLCTGKCVPNELTEYLKTNPTYNLSVIFKSEENQSKLSEIAPFTKNYPLLTEGTKYYLCENGTCRTPVADFKKLPL